MKSKFQKKYWKQNNFIFEGRLSEKLILTTMKDIFSENIKVRALIRECGTSRNVVPTVINHVIKVYSTESTWLECSDQKKPREQKTTKIGQTNLSCTFGLKEQTRMKKVLGTWVPISPTIWRPDMEISCFTKFFKISLKQHSQRQQ